jgi:putative hydrolase of the HAD superfamily
MNSSVRKGLTPLKQYLLFDLDDTLIYCNKYFHFVLEQFADLLSAWFSPYGIAREAICGKQAEIDVAGVQVFGFRSDHFPRSLVETYRHFCAVTGREASPDEERRLHRLGLSVYEHEVEPYPQMEETLETLAASGHRLHLYTGGDSAIQRRKIRKLKLERYFQDRIYIRQHKDTAALQAVLKEADVDPERTWMIGNSLRTDILPALESGIRAIYMKRQGEWAYNVLPAPAVRSKGAFLTLTELSAIPSAIHRYMERNA